MALEPQLRPKLKIISTTDERDGDLRYQRASSVVDDLRGLKRDTGSGRAALGDSNSQVIARLVERHEKAIMALMATGLVIAAAFIYGFYRAERLAPTTPAALQISRVTGSGDIVEADISPDGKFVAYVRETGGRQHLWLKQLATERDIPITDWATMRARGSHSLLTAATSTSSARTLANLTAIFTKCRPWAGSQEERWLGFLALRLSHRMASGWLLYAKRFVSSPC